MLIIVIIVVKLCEEKLSIRIRGLAVLTTFTTPAASLVRAALLWTLSVLQLLVFESSGETIGHYIVCYLVTFGSTSRRPGTGHIGDDVPAVCSRFLGFSAGKSSVSFRAADLLSACTTIGQTTISYLAVQERGTVPTPLTSLKNRFSTDAAHAVAVTACLAAKARRTVVSTATARSARQRTKLRYTY